MSFHHNNAHEEHNKTRPTSTLTESRLLPPNSTRELDDHILTIDWDGPDDPENPRKYARHHFPFRIRLNWLQLELQQEVASNNDRVCVHVHQPCFFLNDRPGFKTIG